jgi:hypothetical protein
MGESTKSFSIPRYRLARHDRRVDWVCWLEDNAWRTPAGIRRSLHQQSSSVDPPWGRWLERVVFSSPFMGQPHPLPFATNDYPSRQLALSEDNFMDAVQASCSFPLYWKLSTPYTAHRQALIGMAVSPITTCTWITVKPKA